MKYIVATAIVLFIHVNTLLFAQDLQQQQKAFDEGLDLFYEGEEIFNDDALFLSTESWEIEEIYSEATEQFLEITDMGDLGKSALYYMLLCNYRTVSLDYEDELDSAFVEGAKELALLFDQMPLSNFPSYYNYKGKRYVINLSNFEYFRNELYNRLVEIEGVLKNHVETIKYAKIAYGLSNNSGEKKLLALLHIAAAKEELGQYDLELVENNIRYLETYNSLTADEKSAISGWLSSDAAVKMALEGFTVVYQESSSLKNNSDLLFRFSRALSPLDAEEANAAYQKAMQATGISSDQLFGVVDFGLKQNASLALQAADQLNKRNLNCSDYSRLGQAYSSLGETQKSKAAANKAIACREKEERATRRANATRPRLFVGIHPGQYLKSVETRDPGAVLGIINGNSMTSVSLSKVTNDAYQMLDLYLNDITTPGFQPKWDGYRAGISFRTKPTDKFNNKEWNYYYGIQLAYANEKLQAFTDEVTNLSTNEKTLGTFTPIDHSYRIYYNIGSTYYWYVLGIDMNINFGLSVNQFDLNNDNYTFDHFNQFTNPMLEFRKGKKFHYGSLIQFNFVTYLVL
jgi:hypothetical protein